LLELKYFLKGVGLEKKDVLKFAKELKKKDILSLKFVRLNREKIFKSVKILVRLISSSLINNINW